MGGGRLSRGGGERPARERRLAYVWRASFCIRPDVIRELLRRTFFFKRAPFSSTTTATTFEQKPFFFPLYYFQRYWSFPYTRRDSFFFFFFFITNIRLASVSGRVTFIFTPSFFFSLSLCFFSSPHVSNGLETNSTFTEKRWKYTYILVYVFFFFFYTHNMKFSN